MTSSGEHVMVTGATGFTGGHLARTLAQRGYHVRALVRNGANTTDLEVHGVQCVEGDLVDRDSVLRAAEGIDCIYHIAAVYRSAKHPDSYYWDVNVGGTQHVLDAARHHGVKRTVHCSTAGVHGDVKTIPADEDSPLRPGDVYQETKLAGERIAADAFANGLPGVIFRPVGIYGPGDTRFLKLFKTIQSGQFRMFGTGKILYHLTYIDDLIDGVIRCGTSPHALGRVYLLVGPRYTSIEELARHVAAAVNVKPPSGTLPLWPLLSAAAVCEYVCRPLRVEPPLHRRRIDFFRKDRAFSIERARRELGYNPVIDLAEGLSRTARWYAANGHLPALAASQSSSRSVAAGEQGRPSGASTTGELQKTSR
jgi:dihydroflavonol-4-reductase